MYCPHCGYQQVSDETRFCSRCGLSLSLVIDLLAKSSNQVLQQKREITGIGLMMGTVLMLMNFLFVFGLVTLPHIANPVFLWIWLSFVLSSLVVGGFGVANLVRGGFFRRLKERDARLRLMQAVGAGAMLPEEPQPRSFDVESAQHLAERVSVTEGTTRELEAVEMQTGENLRKE